MNSLLHNHLREDSLITKRSKVRRQDNMPSAEDIIGCSLRAARARCESNKFYQRLVDSALDCGLNGLAEQYAGYCTTNPAAEGEYCAALVLNAIEDFINVNTNCRSTGETSVTVCPVNCAPALRAIKNRFGCCINSVFNTSSGPDTLLEDSETDPVAAALQSLGQIFSEVFNDSLWSLCGVETVRTICDNTKTVTPKYDSPICTISELAQQEFDIVCGSESLEEIDKVLKDKNCFFVSRTINDVCEVNSEGQYCFLLTVGSSDSQTPGSVSEVETECSQFQETCPIDCRSALEEFRNNLGCCVNRYNTSTTGVTYQFETSYALWNQCGVDTTGVCESILNRSPATTEAMSLLSVAMLAAIVQYMHVHA